MDLPDDFIPFALTYREPGQDDHLQARAFRAVTVGGLVVAAIRIGEAFATGQSWLGLFLVALPHLVDARYWYAFLHGPVTLLLGVSLLIATTLLLVGHRTAARWIHVNEGLALIVYSLMLIFNFIANIQNARFSQFSVVFHISTLIGSLQHLIFPLIVVLLLKTPLNRRHATSETA